MNDPAGRALGLALLTLCAFLWGALIVGALWWAL